MDWKHLLAYITGTVDQELLLRNEYLVTENRILRHQIKGRVRLSDGERKTLAEIGQKLGKQALAEVANIVKPDTDSWLAPHSWWLRSLTVPNSARLQGDPRSIRSLRPWWSAWRRRIARGATTGLSGALANLGYTISDQTVGNILKRHGTPPRQSARRPPRGRSSSARTWTCSWPPTSSPPRSGRWVGW